MAVLSACDSGFPLLSLTRAHGRFVCDGLAAPKGGGILSLSLVQRQRESLTVPPPSVFSRLL